MLGSALPALDLSALLQFVFASLLTISAAILVAKRASSKYFVVDGRPEDGKISSAGGISVGDDERAAAGGTCANCENPGNKKCSRCKTVRYCSQTCQSKHWAADHKYKCKLPKPSDKAEIVSSGSVSCRRRKLSGLSSISLVPARGTCNILQEPKKILFPYDDFLKLYNWTNPGFPPCGLVNCGNSCFANVVLQCLACTRPLIAYLLERNHTINCIRKQDDWCFLCELQEHIRTVSRSQHPFSPLRILSRLPNIGGNLGYGRQEDAHEFMRFAIDTMQSVCLDQFGGEKAIDFSTQETTLIHYIFGGHLQSQVTCTICNMISNRYENMMDLTVEIQGDVESLEECLEQFTGKEWLDGENKYKCDGCNDYVRAWKRLTVHQAPNILTIALKRFQSGRFGKLNKRVTFPENLDLTPYMSGNGDGTDKYTLYAVVVHVDMLNASFFGHYICYTKDFYGQWYRIDDCKVMKVEVEDVLAEGAYMLLYSRRSARKPFVKPLDPERNKQLSEAIPNFSASNLANSVSVSSLPLDVDIQLNSDENLPVRNNGTSITSADFESPKAIKANKMAVEPLDPEINKQSSESIPHLSSTSNLANSVSVSSLPLDVDKQLNSDKNLPVRNNGNNIISADFESPSSKMVVDSPAIIQGSADVEVDTLSPSSQVAKENGEENHRPSVLEDTVTADNMQLDKQEISSQEVHVKKYNDSCGHSDVSSCLEEDSGSYTGKVTNVSYQTLDESIVTQNEADPNPPFSSLATIKDLVSRKSEDLMALTEEPLEICNGSESAVKVGRINGPCHGNDNSKILASIDENRFDRKLKPLFASEFLNKTSFRSADDKSLLSHQENGSCMPSEVNCTLPSQNENGFSKQKPLFSLGFLDKPTKMKTVDVRKTINESNLVDCVTKQNGYSDGRSALESMGPSDNSNSQDPCGPHSNGFLLHSSHHRNEDEILRLQNSNSNEISVTAFVNGTCNGMHAKDEC